MAFAHSQAVNASGVTARILFAAAAVGCIIASLFFASIAVIRLADDCLVFVLALLRRNFVVTAAGIFAAIDITLRRCLRSSWLWRRRRKAAAA